ncbi:[FeFe] hydrogenase H-cluster radical SAM maturase HydG [bacterium]|nr:[FeFe] hydrogenase H-cluster radical SAM maturase HydG [bacterium]|tara:strand:- start:4996 stop:6372 length:1377 start_codon:yes stop_codon:yes gene_type:complete
MTTIKDIINEQKIFDILEKTKNPTSGQISKILKKGLRKKGLTLKEVGFLLNTEKPKLIEQMFSASSRIKNEIYGERLVFFAPLYISSFCINDCEYCGFHCRNKEVRKKLSLKQVKEQVKILENMGHKRLLLEFGEHPTKNPIDYVVDVIKTIYKTKSGNGEIRRVNINIAATTVENYRKLKSADIGTYQLFQETYHQETYKKLHNGPKADYKRQLFAHDRAFKAGIDDVGLGVLYGLFDYRFDTLALVSHAQYLDKKYNIGPHTLSVPRLQPAPTVDMDLPHKVSKSQLLKIVSILRIAVPYTGMIISTRESPETRAKAFEIGISQTSAASRTTPGGYGKKQALQQFSLQDHRNVEEVLKSTLEQGLLPSFCTACYRLGRTGKTIMKLLKSGKIHDLCRPNAILTFKEYLEDYASDKVKKLGLKIINKYLKQISDNKIQQETKKRLKKIANRERDIYF